MRAPYKRPRQVFFRESLPKSPIGKVLRRELRPNGNAAQTQAVRYPLAG